MEFSRLRTLALSLPLLALAYACSSSPERTLRSESGKVSKVPNTGDQQGADAEQKEDSTSSSKDSKDSKDPTKPEEPAGHEIPTNPNPQPKPEEPETQVPVTGLECTKSAVVKNVKFCESTVEGVAVKWIPLDGNPKPSRIALYMHGDTANDWYDPFVAVQFAAWAKKNNILIVLSRSTTRYDGDPADEWSYGAAQPEDARKLEKALASIIAKYQAPSDNLLYFGVSGGPWFMSSSWIPLMAGKYPGLFALSCGGSQAWQKFAWDTKDAALTSKIKIFYNFGDKDFLAEYEERSYQHYLAAGIETTKKVHAGATHCSHDIYGPTIAFWEANMK